MLFTISMQRIAKAVSVTGDDEEEERHAYHTQCLHFFSHENLYIFFRSIRGLAIELPQSASIAVIRRSVTGFRFYFHFFFAVVNASLHCTCTHTLSALYYVCFITAHIRTRFKSVAAFLSCHTIGALLLHFTLLYFTFDSISCCQAAFFFSSAHNSFAILLFNAAPFDSIKPFAFSHKRHSLTRTSLHGNALLLCNRSSVLISETK